MSNAPARRRITILGSTGSIGRSALEVVRLYPERFEVAGLAAGANVTLLAAQVAEFKPDFVSVGPPDAAAKLESEFPELRVWPGVEGLCALAEVDVDVVLCAVVGAVGLRPLLCAIEAGNRVAVANKEPFVMAGRLVMELAAARGVGVLPVDSEHSAIFQCLRGHVKEEIGCIHLTASGGPFYGRARKSLADITPAEAANHPTWDMGAKISVDSATLMNKGLEIIEAMWLFGLPEARIDVVIHPQSIVHSLVEFTDGNILAHLGVTDMKFPILYALAYPERVERAIARLDLKHLRELTFAAPAFEEFPCLGLARAAAAEGGTAPAVLNAANEEAVAAFCAGRLPFLGISDVVARVREVNPARQDYGLESVLEADRAARQAAHQVIAAEGN